MIRPIVRSVVYTGAALWLTSQISGGGITYAHGVNTFLVATLAVSITNHLVRPVLNLLLLPINLITLGLFRWVTSVLLLYLVTLFVPGFTISSFDFMGFEWQGIIVPEIHLTGFMSLLAVSFVLSFISSFLFWLAK